MQTQQNNQTTTSPSSEDDDDDQTSQLSEQAQREELEKDLGEVVKTIEIHPRWIFSGGIIVIGVILSILSAQLTVGPSWMVPLITVILLIPTFMTSLKGYHRMTRPLALSIMSILTLALIASVVLLIGTLFNKTPDPVALLRDAALLWVANLIIFALWYWEIDGGGSIMRRSHHAQPADFAFPQMISKIDGWENWQSDFVDYIFLAFNTNTAFSPTDTLVLSRRVKILCMLQSLISLLTVTGLVARAINMA